MFNSKKNRRKVMVSLLLIICTILCNVQLYYADDNIMENVKIAQGQTPERVEEYFYSIYENAIEIGIQCKLIDESINNEELEAGENFIIFNVDKESSNIWYYPIYYNSQVIIIIAIVYMDNELNFSLTQEFVESLNSINYNSDMIIFKENEDIFVINQENCIYKISDGETNQVSLDINYTDLLLNVVNNYELTEIEEDVKKTEITQNSRLRAKGGSIKDITGGKECIMTDCFVRQYEYNICWAACIATTLRYLKTEYMNIKINAIDVAKEWADYNDDTEWNKGANDNDVHVVYALYGVYYSIVNRALNYTEIKNEIDNGYPIYMHSSAYYKNEWHGHATLLYGYYSKDQYKYFKIWNPGNASTLTATYNLAGDINIFYNNNYFKWTSSLGQGGYIFK